MSAVELALAACAGALLGAAAGLLPGAHPNAVAVVALGALPALPAGMAMPLVAGLAAMAIAHQFTAAVPATLLGAPADDHGLRVLPAQELVRRGRAGEAVQLAAVGTAWGLAAAALLLVPLHLLLGPRGEGYRWLEPALPLVLAAIAAVLLLTEEARVPHVRALRAEAFPEEGDVRVDGRVVSRRGDVVVLAGARGRVRVHDPLGLLDGLAPGASARVRGRWARVEGPVSALLGVLAAAAVFGLAALLGRVAQGLATPSPLGLPGSPMLPLLTGLFGVPSLLLAMRAPPLPPQREAPAPAERGVVPASLAGGACGTLVGLLPGMSSSAAAVLALLAVGHRGREATLAALSAAGGGAAITTVAAFVLLGRARSGVMLAVEEVAMPEPWLALAPPRLLLVLLLGCAAGALLGAGLCRLAGRAGARLVHHLPYARLSAVALAALIAVVGAFTGPWGLALLAVAACVGLLPWRWGLRKGHLMGCTMGPLIASGWGLG